MPVGAALYQGPRKAKGSTGGRRGQRPGLQSAAPQHAGPAKARLCAALSFGCILTSASPGLRTPQVRQPRPGGGEGPRGRDPAARHTPPCRSAAPWPRPRPLPLLLCAVGAVARVMVPPPPQPRPVPPLRPRPVPARPPAQPQSAGAATAGSGASFRGRRREQSSSLRLCSRAPWPLVTSVRWPGPADPLALRLAARLHGRRRDPPTRPCLALVCPFGPCR